MVVISGKPVPFHTVKISEAASEVLEIHLATAWRRWAWKLAIATRSPWTSPLGKGLRAMGVHSVSVDDCDDSPLFEVISTSATPSSVHAMQRSASRSRSSAPMHSRSDGLRSVPIFTSLCTKNDCKVKWKESASRISVAQSRP